MNYLLDTNVISELRKAGSDRIDPHVKRWAEITPSSSLFLSVITVLELDMGILLLERKDPAQGTILRTWFNNNVLPAFQTRTLDIDLKVARRCALLHVPDRRSDRDALIAATALVYEMTVVTRNRTDFEGTGVELINPWDTC